MGTSNPNCDLCGEPITDITDIIPVMVFNNAGLGHSECVKAFVKFQQTQTIDKRINNPYFPYTAIVTDREGQERMYECVFFDLRVANTFPKKIKVSQSKDITLKLSLTTLKFTVIPRSEQTMSIRHFIRPDEKVDIEIISYSDKQNLRKVTGRVNSIIEAEYIDGGPCIDIEVYL